jgi:hypothetical protein
MIIQLTPWVCVTFEKLLFSLIVKKFPEFYEPVGSLRFEQQSALVPILIQTDMTLFCKIDFSIIIPSTRISFKWLFSSCFSVKSIEYFDAISIIRKGGYFHTRPARDNSSKLVKGTIL